MLCGYDDSLEPTFLQLLETTNLKEGFLESFVDDILFWENAADLWADPNGSKDEACRSAHQAKHKDSSTNGRPKNTHSGGELDEIALKALSQSHWKVANDPRSGRTYFYHSKTRVTQWEKPVDVKTLEAKLRQEKREKDAMFFREMEQNLHSSIGRGELIPGIRRERTIDQTPMQSNMETSQKSKHVRTISRMDGRICFQELGDQRSVQGSSHKALNQQHQLLQQKPSAPTLQLNQSGKPPLPRTAMIAKGNSMELSSPEEDESSPEKKNISSMPAPPPVRMDSGLSLDGETLIDAPMQVAYDVPELNPTSQVRSQAGHARRNTGGTIFLDNTMTKPDIQATIKCVCGVYRAHILQGIEQQRKNRGHHESRIDLNVFLDHGMPPSHQKPAVVPRQQQAPTLLEVFAFYEEFFLRSKMEHDTIIMSLIYVERLVKATDGELNPTPENWRSILFACMVLASKVWDDLSMWNVDFSNVSTNAERLFSFSLRRINELELHLLKHLNFDVRVGASEYAKYYFLIRSMLVRGGLVQGSERPLGKTELFQRLEARTNTYQANQLDAVDQNDRRSKSMDDNFWRWISKNKQRKGPVFSDSVCLEQIIGSNR